MVNDLYIECASDGSAGRAKERESSRDTPRRRSDSGKGVACGERTTHAHTHRSYNDDWQVEPSGGRLRDDVD